MRGFLVGSIEQDGLVSSFYPRKKEFVKYEASEHKIFCVPQMWAKKRPSSLGKSKKAKGRDLSKWFTPTDPFFPVAATVHQRNSCETKRVQRGCRQQWLARKHWGPEKRFAGSHLGVLRIWKIDWHALKRTTNTSPCLLWFFRDQRKIPH